MQARWLGISVDETEYLQGSNVRLVFECNGYTQ